MFAEDKRKKLEKRRTEILSDIRGEQLSFEAMAQRPRRAADPLDNTFSAEVLKRLADIAQRAERATNVDDLDDLVADAEQQGS